MTAKPPKTRPSKFACDLPAGRARMIEIGKHNASEFKRLFGLDVAPYEIRDCENQFPYPAQRLVFIPMFVWDRWYKRPLKKVRWIPAFGHTLGNLNPGRLP